MNITVVGLGKIGLPLAVQFAESGHRVVGADINPKVVSTVNAGHTPFPGEADLPEKLARVVAGGMLIANTDTQSAVADADAVVVVVPLFVDHAGVPDFAALDSATAAIGSGMSAGVLVAYETTLPVGTTRRRFAPMLEQRSGLAEGTDFHAVFSPERVLTGRVFADLRKYPKLVGGLSQQGAERAREFYEAVLQFDERPDLERPNGVWDMGTAEAAEMAKLAETTYRDVNIGLANQFARFASANGIDIHNVIEASNSQPFSHVHRPGIAVGGHCIPVYPKLYLWTDPDATVVQAARAANEAMPKYELDRLVAATGPIAGKKVAVLGASYRGGVKETAFSGAFPVVDQLVGLGAEVAVHDPMYDDDELIGLGFTPFRFGEDVEIVVVQADHAEYRQIGDAELPGVRWVLDGRNIVQQTNFSSAEVLVIGSGGAS